MLYVQDAIRRLETFKQELVNNMPAISIEVTGLFLSAKIAQIKREGIGKYSPKKYSAHFLKGKELNSTGRSFLDAKIKANEKTNWAELRHAQGLQISFVDVYYSGQMLNYTGIQRNNSVSYRYYSIIGGRNKEARDKLAVNAVRYGRFLTPNNDQTKLIGKRSIKLIGNIYKRILLT